MLGLLVHAYLVGLTGSIYPVLQGCGAFSQARPFPNTQGAG